MRSRVEQADDAVVKKNDLQESASDDQQPSSEIDVVGRATTKNGAQAGRVNEIASRYSTAVSIGVSEQGFRTKVHPKGHRLHQTYKSEHDDVCIINFWGSPKEYNNAIARCQQVIADNVGSPVLLVLPPERILEINRLPLSSFLDREEFDCVFAPFHSAEVQYRSRKLLQSWLKERPAQSGDDVFSHFVPSLHQSKSGRIDAKRTSELFGLTLTDTAQILDRQLSTVARTPDAAALQPGLRIFERIASSLLFLTRTPHGLRMWMNAANPEFEGKTPLEMVKEGLGEIVAIRLENSITGQPD